LLLTVSDDGQDAFIAWNFLRRVGGTRHALMAETRRRGQMERVSSATSWIS
jgi:hypothetical protein